MYVCVCVCEISSLQKSTSFPAVPAHGGGTPAGSGALGCRVVLKCQASHEGVWPGGWGWAAELQGGGEVVVDMQVDRQTDGLRGTVGKPRPEAQALQRRTLILLTMCRTFIKSAPR